MCAYMYCMCTTHMCVCVTERESEPRKAPLNKVDSYIMSPIIVILYTPANMYIYVLKYIVYTLTQMTTGSQHRSCFIYV